MLRDSCLVLALAVSATVFAATATGATPEPVMADRVDAADCTGVPGAVVHDDGTYESGFGGYFKSVDNSEFVEKFTPSVHPATWSAACVAITYLGADPVEGFEFHLVVYDDDGEDGGPGAQLASLPAQIASLPPYVFCAEGQFFRIDLGAAAVTVADGSAYIGVQWNDMAWPGRFIFINSDGWSGGPFGGGYYRNTFTPWTPMYFAFLSDYRALQIRAIERALQPTLAVDTGAVTLQDHCAADPARANGVAEPGEVVDVAVPVFASTGDFSSVQVTLLPPAPAGVEYLVASAALGDLADGTRAVAPLQLALAPAAACLQDITLPLTISSSEGSFEASVTLPVGRRSADIAPVGLPLKIPNADSNGIRSSIEVPGAFPLQGLAVSVQLNHFTVSDLIIRLSSPAGTTVTLLDRPGYPPFPGCENSVGDLLFMDGAPDPENTCAEPAGGTPWPVHEAGPIDPLATFEGEDTQGTWTLTVIDDDFANSGALTGWSLLPAGGFTDTCTPCGELQDAVFQDGFDGG